MDDAVARYRAATETNDIEMLVNTLAPDVELVSPISGRMVFRGKDDLRVLATAVYGSMTGLRWRKEVGDDTVRVVIGDAKVGRLNIADAMVFELAADGQIKRITPHLRPWLALTLLAVKLGLKLAGHPGLIRRALRFTRPPPAKASAPPYRALRKCAKRAPGPRPQQQRPASASATSRRPGSELRADRRAKHQLAC